MPESRPERVKRQTRRRARAQARTKTNFDCSDRVTRAGFETASFLDGGAYKYLKDISKINSAARRTDRSPRQKTESGEGKPDNRKCRRTGLENIC